MRVHRAVGEDDLDVAAANAARFPCGQRQRAEIGDEVRLPHMIARLHLDEVAFAREISFLSHAFGEREAVVEDEALVAIHVHEERQVVGRNQTQRLAAGGIEQPEWRVQGHREQGPRAEFEALGLASAEIDRRAAVPGEDVEDVVIEMPGPVRLAARWNFDHLECDKIATAAQVHKSAPATAAQPCPRSGFHGVQVDGDTLDDGDLLGSRPVEISIDQIAQFCVCWHSIPQALSFWLGDTYTRTPSPAVRGPPADCNIMRLIKTRKQNLKWVSISQICLAAPYPPN